MAEATKPPDIYPFKLVISRGAGNKDEMIQTFKHKLQQGVYFVFSLFLPFRRQLSFIYDVIQQVDPLDSQDTAHLALLTRPELGITFTKLHCWRLAQFRKCVFIDADCLVRFSFLLVS